MLTLHVEAPTVNELVQKALKEMHITLTAVDSGAPPAEGPAPVANIAEAREKKRGRPPTAPAGAPASGVPAPQAQVGNSASAPAVPPAAEDVAAVPAKAGASAVPSKDDVRAALHSVTVMVEGDANTAAGLKRASEILTTLGYRKISDVKPEDGQKLINACALKMKDLKPLA